MLHGDVVFLDGALDRRLGVRELQRLDGNKRGAVPFSICSKVMKCPASRLHADPEGAGLNPIEQVFAKLKHLLRKAAARTVETICIAVGELLATFSATFSAEECANYFSNSGYQA